MGGTYQQVTEVEVFARHPSWAVRFSGESSWYTVMQRPLSANRPRQQAREIGSLR